jgi:beta-glucosidase
MHDPEATTARRLPDDFVFGVATSGFQVEGGYNGPGEPANNWLAWERSGRVEPSGIALDFWNRYEDHVARAASLGIDSFRLSVEWARCEPAEGVLDGEALGRYRAILDACRDNGLEPLVTLHHFTHPGWLGSDFWLENDSPQRYARWVETAVGHLGSGCTRWITLNEINALAEQSYLTGSYPPGRRGDQKAAARALDNLLTAHVLGYETVHRLQPNAVVTTNNSSSSVYELDRLLCDVLMSRSYGIGPDDELHRWLPQRRAAFYDRIDRARRPSPIESALRRLIARMFPLESALPRAAAAVHESSFGRSLDVVGISYYDPCAAHAIRVPGHRTSGGRSLEPARQLWDLVPDPSGLVAYADANCEPSIGLWVVENGMANRVRRGRSYRRLDGWERARYLRDHLEAVAAAARAGTPVSGYWHWTLADNYEWGSYEPRFGLFGVDRERGLRWSEADSMGCRSADAYRRLVASMRGGRPIEGAARRA